MYAVIDKVNSSDIYAYVHNPAAMCPILKAYFYINLCITEITILMIYCMA